MRIDKPTWTKIFPSWHHETHQLLVDLKNKNGNSLCRYLKANEISQSQLHRKMRKNKDGIGRGVTRNSFNSITYGILRFCRLRGGLFGPDPENKNNVNWFIWNLVPVMVCIKLVNIQNFKLLAFLLLEYDDTKVLIAIRYLPPKFKKNQFLCLK